MNREIEYKIPHPYDLNLLPESIYNKMIRNEKFTEEDKEIVSNLYWNNETPDLIK